MWSYEKVRVLRIQSWVRDGTLCLLMRVCLSNRCIFIWFLHFNIVVLVGYHFLGLQKDTQVRQHLCEVSALVALST